MDWIYLSPHFDDVALSCGGLVWEQAQGGSRVQIWTITGGEPETHQLSPFAEQLHARWETGPEAWAQRRQEDALACRILGAERFYFPIQDCIYRQDPSTGQFLYDSEEDLWTEVHPSEEPLVAWLQQELEQRLPPEASLVCPLTIGNHVDHRLTRRAAERLQRPLWYYPDYPYVLDFEHDLAALPAAGWEAVVHPVSQPAQEAWIEAVAAHASQISSFWHGLDDMRRAMQAYCHKMGGIQLWRIKTI